ncbi:MAG TPA: AAA family ATPase [Planctomycetaceae bacterium]|nr:AAA family ATPase [Planctomycetaceae bacterium]
MKIRQLHINRFGHFTDRDLVFQGDGLQVIYGPNEAGKTTLLEFLRGLLFDFPARTPYDFGGQGEMAGVATLELRDRRIVELRRRKGNKDKVAIKLDGLATDLDDTGWLRLLDHADRGLFESAFAFGLDQLSQGEASLKHESLQSALFGGGLGGTSSPDKVVAELSRQADVLFKRGGSKPTINALLAEFKKLSKEIRDLSLRPEKFHEAELAVANATTTATELHTLVDELRRSHAKVEKRVRAWPKWWELQQRRDERGSLIVPANVPGDARQQYQTVCKELKSLEAEQTTCTNEINRAEQELATLKLDPGAVSYREEIKSCLELRQSYIEARNQLPERQRERESIRTLIDRDLAELRPGWSHDDLLAFSIDVATRAEIDRLSDNHRKRSTDLTKLTTKRGGDAANLERARDELAEIGASRDITDLAAVLTDEADCAANRKQLESARGDLAKLERKLTTQSRKLTPPLLAAIPAPHELPVPRSETVAEFATRFADLREELRIEQAAFKANEEKQTALEKSLATAMSSRAVPSLDERDAARQSRDAGWMLFRRKHIANETVDGDIASWLDETNASVLPDGYEQAVRHADDVADTIYENANEVAEREGLHRQLATIKGQLDQNREQITKLQQKQVELQTQWATLWQPCGLEPLAPDAMLAWLGDHAAACATISQREELLDLTSQIGERISSFERRLRDACEIETGEVSVLLMSAKQAIETANDQRRRTGELQKEIRRLDKQLAKYDAEIADLERQEADSSTEWQVVLTRLNLPTEWDIELARDVIDNLKATRVRLDALPGEENRIAAMQSRITELDDRVHSLCEMVSPALMNDPTELAIKKLDEQVERAVEAQRTHDDLSQRRVDAGIRLDKLKDQIDVFGTQRASLFTTAAVSDEAAFLDVVTQAEKCATLDREIEQLARDIDLIRAGDDRDEFESSLAQSDQAVLAGEAKDLGAQLRQQEELKSEADRKVGSAQGELDQLVGSDTVARLTEELARKRALLAAEVDRYMPLVYARHLLNAAVSRFEKENQPEMIATVSRLLTQMTGGKYIEFDRSGGGRQNMLIRRADGIERTPDQLSTGTREQLYLAIRLAYVLHYCQKSESLPVIIDDVLVNFDDQRAKQTLTALAGISQSAQVLFFTCHAHMVEIAKEVVPGLVPVSLSGE